MEKFRARERGRLRARTLVVRQRRVRCAFWLLAAPVAAGVGYKEWQLLWDALSPAARVGLALLAGLLAAGFLRLCLPPRRR